MNKNFIIGAGLSGLGAGIASGFPIFEAEENAGGICSSYYISRSGSLLNPDSSDITNAWRFERGGGHWFFSGNPALLRYLSRYSQLEYHERKASVYLGTTRFYVPYPIQHHIQEPQQKDKPAAQELISNGEKIFSDHLEEKFGKYLCDLFFHPFHEKYTAGLYRQIGVQDEYKTPSSKFTKGYNSKFAYPNGGLYELTKKLATRCDIRFGKRVTEINTKSKQLVFSDDTVQNYDQLISTLPLNTMANLTHLAISCRPDPFTSVLVLNIGGLKHPGCTQDHWIYTPHSKSGFHRIGIYSNVSEEFLPAELRRKAIHASLYVEKSFEGIPVLSANEIELYKAQVIAELQEMKILLEPEVIHVSFIEVAYTWRWPKSSWRETMIQSLADKQIFQLGRFAEWRFQGMAESFENGYRFGKKK